MVLSITIEVPTILREATIVLGSEKIIEQVASFTRATGPSLSAFNAWIVLKGLDTLSLRMNAHCENALKVATWLDQRLI
jgi:O-succinylhomoserine sulfhydrylase